MKRTFINLQHFAEESEQESASSAQQQTETGAQQQASGKKELKYTDEDVDELINQKFAEWSKKKDREVSEAQRLAEMSAQEKAEYERDRMEKELNELKEKNALSEMAKTARKMLSDSDINVPDELLTFLVSSDAEKTKKAVESFAALFKGTVKTAVANALKGEPPKTGTTKGITKEQIMAIKDRNARQKAIN